MKVLKVVLISLVLISNVACSSEKLIKLNEQYNRCMINQNNNCNQYPKYEQKNNWVNGINQIKYVRIN